VYEYDAHPRPHATEYEEMLLSGKYGSWEKPLVSQSLYEIGVMLRGAYEQPEVQWLQEFKIPHRFLMSEIGTLTVTLFTLNEAMRFKLQFMQAESPEKVS
jgi:hypothetical protein